MVTILGSPSTPGPEAALVESFLSTALPPPLADECLSVFVEPQLESWRPDVVAVYWDWGVAQKWPEERRHLVRGDLRVAQLIHSSGPLAEDVLKTYFPRGLRAHFRRLEQAGLIELDSEKRWQMRSLEEVFAVRRIVACEAKMSALSAALRQAHRNTWFASESYVVTRMHRVTGRILDRAELQGIGLWLLDGTGDSQPLVEARRYSLPQSHASWALNELAWKTRIGVSGEHQHRLAE